MKINLQGISTEEALHKHLAHCLDLPDWCGHNWDSFWDAITDQITLPHRVVFVGFKQLSKVLPDDAAKLQHSFEQLAVEYPEIECDVTYR